MFERCSRITSSQRAAGINALGDVVAVDRRGDRQHLADRLDPMDLAMIAVRKPLEVYHLFQ